MVLHAISVESAKLSCGSIPESFVSKYENHFDEHCNVSDKIMGPHLISDITV